MNSPVWYHGANGDNIIQIIREGKMRPNNGQIFYSSSGYSGCFAMGADLKRRACYVIQVRCQIPNDVRVENRSTNVPGTKVVLTSSPITVEVLELYIRAAKATTVSIVKGRSAIEKYFSTLSH